MKIGLHLLSGAIAVFLATTAYSQNCTLTAGPDQAICEGTQTTLSGNVSGSFNPASILWTQFSGPASTITSSTSSTTTVTGLSSGNIYVYVLQAECTIGGIVYDTIIVDDQSTLVISAGPDNGLCLSGSVNMNATLPAGYTGTWSSPFGFIQFSDVNDPNATVTSSSDCPWYPTATLTWTVSNGVCSTSDDMILTMGIDPSQTSLSAQGSIICGTTYTTVAWCAHLANSSIVITPITDPSSATVTPSVYGQNSIRFSVTGLNSLGLHEYEVSITSTICGGTFTDTISFFVDALTPPNSSFTTNIGLSYGQGGPQYYRFCLDGFDEDTIWMYSNTSTPAGGTTTWTINNGSIVWPYNIDDPNADTTFMTFNSGAFNPGGLYYIRRTVVTAGGCTSTSTHGAIFYEEPDPIATVDTVICTGNAVNLGLTEGMFPIHDAGSNYPRFVLSSSSGIMTQIGGPGATISRVYQNNSNQLDDYFRFSGLTQGNVYTFEYRIGNNTSTFDYNNCYSGPLRDTFTITYADPVGIATGTNQFLSCGNFSTALVGNEGVGQTGVWSFGSGPTTPVIADANDPTTTVSGMTVDGDYYFHWTVSNPCETRVDSVKVTVQDGGTPIISVTDLPNCIGDIIDLTATGSTSSPGTGPLYYTWDISGTPTQGQTINNVTAGQLSYTVTVIDSSILCPASATLELNCPLPVNLFLFEGELIDDAHTLLDWATASETNNDYFTIERSADMENWEFVLRRDASEQSNSELHYSDVDFNPLMGTSYYRISQTDFDGTFYTYPTIVAIHRDQNTGDVVVYPQPTDGKVTIYFRNLEDKINNIGLFSLTGDIVKEIELDMLNDGLLELNLKAEQLSSGTYLLRIQTEEETILKRIIFL